MNFFRMKWNVRSRFIVNIIITFIASSLEEYLVRAIPWFKYNRKSWTGPCCIHNVFNVEPSIWGVKFLSNSHVETQLELLTGFDWRPPQELEDFVTLPKPAQPLLVLPAPLLPRPGGGPRALLIGAPQSSEVTAVGGGADSHVFFELHNKIEYIYLSNRLTLFSPYSYYPLHPTHPIYNAYDNVDDQKSIHPYKYLYIM